MKHRVFPTFILVIIGIIAFLIGEKAKDATPTTYIEPQKAIKKETA